MSQRIPQSQRAEVATIVLLALLVVGGAIAMFRPKVLHGDSRRAEEAKAATVEVKTTTGDVDAVAKKRSAVAAASVVKIGEAAASMEASPEKDFIVRETPVALASLEAPDPSALLAAERRKVAVLEGRTAEITRLYGDAVEQARRNSDALAKAQRERDAAFARVDASNEKLAVVAAERLAASKTMWRFIIVSGVLVGLYMYVKLTHVSPAAMREAVADIRGGANPITALDGVTTRLQQSIIRTLTKLKT